MPEATVSITRIQDSIADAALTAVGMIGGMERFVQPGETILLKPNLVAPRPSSTGATTNLELVAAVAEMVRQCGGRPVLYENPAFDWDKNAVFKVLGIYDWAKRQGVEIADEGETVAIHGESSPFLNRMRLPKLILETKFINIPKLKTHVFSTMSCAVKNLVGILPTEERRWLHVLGVHQAIADLAAVMNPVLNIVDASDCMQGDGPAYGDPIKMDLILAGADMISVDETCARLIGLEPDRVEYLRILRERYGTRPVEIIGESVESVAKEFKIPAGMGKMEAVFRMMYLVDSVYFRHISKYPLNRVLYATGKLGTNLTFDQTKCDKCGKCLEACPFPQCLNLETLEIDYKRCVRCINCYHACEKGAISVKGVSRPEERVAAEAASSTATS